jgi:predicted NUDIX family NTP pyrophosphohydrolase
MPKHSAGVLIYRRRAGKIEVLLVHPGGPFWRNRDKAAWSIPKGEFDPDEDALEAARRELGEETGLRVEGPLTPLAPRRQTGGKVIHVWATENDVDISTVRSNTFSMEWPPRSGRMQEFPEVDRADWFPLDLAREKIHTGQTGFLDELEERLVTGPG